VTTILINALRALIVLLILRLLVRFVMALRQGEAGRRRAVAERRGGRLVRDPHCGTYVPESSALKSGSEHFCSAACRDAWQQAGESVLGGRRREAPRA
jgi:hypothetical protein